MFFIQSFTYLFEIGFYFYSITLGITHISIQQQPEKKLSDFLCLTSILFIFIFWNYWIYTMELMLRVVHIQFTERLQKKKTQTKELFCCYSKESYHNYVFLYIFKFYLYLVRLIETT